MIIAGIALIAAAIIVANAGEKNLKLEEELEASNRMASSLKQAYFAKEEENRILNTCLKTMESELTKKAPQ